MTESTATSEEGSVSAPMVVVAGHVGSRRSAIGHWFARHLGRPCFSVDSASFTADATQTELLDAASEARQMEQAWFESAIANRSVAMLVAPCWIIEALESHEVRDRLWVAWLDVDVDTLIRRSDVHGTDAENLRRHIGRLDAFADAADVRIDANDPDVERVVERLVDCWRRERHLTAVPDTPAAARRADADMAGADTLLGVLREAADHGYTAQQTAVAPDAIECVSCGQSSSPSEFHATRVRRLEGASDVADMMLVAWAPCPRCGRKGVLVLGYGPNATAVDASILADLDLTEADPSPASSVASTGHLTGAPSELFSR